MKTLGVDCEGVIFHAHRRSIPRSLDSLREIVDSGQFENVYVVSKVNILGRIYFPLRLRLLGFERRTGIPRKHVHFCRRHRDKAVICEQLEITHFVDDRFKVLRHMKNVPYRYAFDPKKRDLKKYPEVIDGMTIVRSWGELMPLLLDTTRTSAKGE